MVVENRTVVHYPWIRRLDRCCYFATKMKTRIMQDRQPLRTMKAVKVRRTGRLGRRYRESTSGRAKQMQSESLQPREARCAVVSVEILKGVVEEQDGVWMGGCFGRISTVLGRLGNQPPSTAWQVVT